MDRGRLEFMENEKVCPFCGASDREYVPPPLFVEFGTGYRSGEGYRCLGCGEISEPEDWK